MSASLGVVLLLVSSLRRTSDLVAYSRHLAEELTIGSEYRQLEQPRDDRGPDWYDSGVRSDQA